MSHSCDPNCTLHLWNSCGCRVIGVYAKRRINVGEELTIDYGWDINELMRKDKRKKKRLSPSKCYCESKFCNGTIERDRSLYKVVVGTRSSKKTVTATILSCSNVAEASLTQDRMVAVADITEHARKIETVISSTAPNLSYDYKKHQLWDSSLIGVNTPLVPVLVEYKTFQQSDNAEDCGLLSLLNLFGRIDSLKINENFLLSELKRIQRLPGRGNVKSSSILGCIHQGFFISVFTNKSKLIETRKVHIAYEGGIRTWYDVISQTMHTNIHALLVMGKYGSDQNPVSHCIAVDLIHGLVFDSAEILGVCTVLNVHQLQHKNMPFIESVTGFKLKEKALTEFRSY